MGKVSALKWGKDNERAKSSLRYISEAIKKVLINSPSRWSAMAFPPNASQN